MASLNKQYNAYPKLVSVVGTKSKDKINYMAAAWHCYLSHTPPLYGVSIAPKRFTHNMIVESGEFNCNFLPIERIKLIHGTGRISGVDYDKIKKLNLKTKSGVSIETPYLSDAYTVLECKLKQTLTIGDHTFFIGQITHAIGKDIAFLKNGLLNTQKIYPTLYLGSDTYITIDQSTIRVLP